MTILIDLSLPAYVTLVWGNTSQYGFTALDHQFEQPSSPVFIDFLEPSSTYYYRATASQSGYSPVTRSGSFATGQWPGSTYNARGQPIPQWINGTVKDTNGAAAPAGILIAVSCASNFGFYSTQGFTQSGGQYAIPIANAYWNEEPLLCAVYNRPIVVQVENGDITLWLGHWNETIVVYAAQIVNFELPLDDLTSYLPVIVDFSNAPLESGYTDLSISQGVSFENSYTYSWSVGASVEGIGGGVSGSTTSGVSSSSLYVESVSAGSLCWAAKFVVTGTVQFSAISRSWAFAQSMFDSQDANFCSDVGLPLPADWIPNGTADGAYYMPGPPGSQYASGLHNVGLWHDQGLGESTSFTVSSTSTMETGLSFEFPLSAVLPGSPTLSFEASEEWSQTVTQSNTFAFTLHAGGAYSNVSCYNVLGVGGSQSQGSADSIAIYYWPGSISRVAGMQVTTCA